MAWLELVREESDTEAAIEHAEAAARLSGYNSEFALHTLARAHALAGSTAQARAHLLRVIATRDDLRIIDDDWFVLGRIAEEYALPEVAVDCYERVEKPSPLLADDIWHLAQARLKALQAEQ